ncbi:MAG: histidine phosphatase family protein [Alphaproteobacteria bacterium]|nr:histidine phosphatase family protein [Alphaproteobacteria bacterium]
MKTVYILRHAKSDWAEAGLKDHERPLNDRGREAAPKMGAYLKAKRYKPSLVLCSTARRTVETCDLIKLSLGAGVTVTFEEALYLAEVRQLVERLRRLDDDIETVMIIGHNPGLEQLANGLPASPSTDEEERLHRRMREKFSTCALAVIKLPVKTWREVKMGSGTLKDFMRPKDL